MLTGGDLVASLDVFVRRERRDWERLVDWCWMSSWTAEVRCAAVGGCRLLSVIVSVAMIAGVED